MKRKAIDRFTHGEALPTFFFKLFTSVLVLPSSVLHFLSFVGVIGVPETRILSSTPPGPALGKGFKQFLRLLMRVSPINGGLILTPPDRGVYNAVRASLSGGNPLNFCGS